LSSLIRHVQNSDIGLFIPNGTAKPITKILIPVFTTSKDSIALKYAQHMSKVPAVSVTLLHAVPHNSELQAEINILTQSCTDQSNMKVCSC
jgi:hypothetical protein